MYDNQNKLLFKYKFNNICVFPILELALKVC